jgi:hypothetical protein
LKSKDFPSITGSPATGPIFPKPKMAVPSLTIAQTFEVFEGGYCYCTNFLNIFSEKKGFILLISLKFSSMQIFPELAQNYLDKIRGIRARALSKFFYRATYFQIL